MTDLPETVSSAQLLEHLAAGNAASVSGWSIHADADGIWLTNPYGVDVGLRACTLEGCSGILTSIRQDGHEREWWT